jgi:hypothetical protein
MTAQPPEGATAVSGAFDEGREYDWARYRLAVSCRVMNVTDR